MKGRVYLLTIGTSLVLMAPAAGATAAGGTSARGATTNHTANVAATPNGPERSLQAVVLGDGAGAKKPVGTIRGARKTAALSAEPHYFQVRRNSI
jgi:hypothetical protein